MRALTRKGEVTILEHVGGKTIVRAASGSTRIYIYPPYRWRHVDALITNFHLPRSTLIALVAALVGHVEAKGLRP